MKIFLVILLIVFAEIPNPGPCRLRAADFENCQELCDTSSDCDAWTFHKPSGICEMKESHGWTLVDDRGSFFIVITCNNLQISFLVSRIKDLFIVK